MEPDCRLETASLVDPEGEFIPGETIIKLYYWNRIDGYVTIPGDSLFKVRRMAIRSNLLAKTLPNNFATSKGTLRLESIQEGAVVNPTVALQ